MELGWTLNPMRVALQRMGKDAVRRRGEGRMPCEDTADSEGCTHSAEPRGGEERGLGWILPQAAGRNQP